MLAAFMPGQWGDFLVGIATFMTSAVALFHARAAKKQARNAADNAGATAIEVSKVEQRLGEHYGQVEGMYRQFLSNGEQGREIAKELVDLLKERKGPQS